MNKYMIVTLLVFFCAQARADYFGSLDQGSSYEVIMDGRLEKSVVSQDGLLFVEIPEGSHVVELNAIDLPEPSPTPSPTPTMEPDPDPSPTPEPQGSPNYDLNLDGIVDVFDLLAVVEDLDSGVPKIDFTADGTANRMDLIDFSMHWHERAN